MQHVLVTVASRHGASGEIGEVIAGVLRDHGHTVDSRAPETVATLDSYDAVVVGSAVYVGRWLEPARHFVDRHEATLARMPVWAFSSGPTGSSPAPADQPPEAVAIAGRIGARAHRSFAGRLDATRLGFMERTITAAVHAPRGDFRDWESIREWADQIAAALVAKEVHA